MSNTTFWDQLKFNWKSGISVALISVPLSLSLAIASGASPMTGIITAVWAGLVGGFIGGSKLNIMGPAGALAGILMADTLLYGPGILPFLAIISGIMILIVWMLKWDKYLVFVPSSVVHGFTLGVALTIGFGQLNSALGLTGLPAHATLISNTIESFKHLGAINYDAFIPFLIGLGIMFAFFKYKPTWPNSIIVAILGIIFGYMCADGILPFHFQTIGTKYPGLSNNLFLFPHLSTLLSNASFASLTRINRLTVLLNLAGVITFVAILETLLSAKIADGMSKTKFNQRREVLGLGLANLASGIFGGLPATGVFARTALNVRSGAKSNYSQMINAVAVALISVVFITSFNYLPLSITASILVYVCTRMVVAEHFKKLFKFDKASLVLALVIAALTFVYDATTGILVGTLVALLLMANRVSKTDLGSTADPENFNPEDQREKAVVYRFAGTLTYLNSKAHRERIILIPADRPVVLNFRHVTYIDVDGYEALDEMVEIMMNRNQKVLVAGVRPEMLHFFNQHEWFKKLSEENKVVPSSENALSLCK